MNISLQRPEPSEYAPFYAGYVACIHETDPLAVLENQWKEVVAHWRSIPETLASTVQAPYSWKVRQVLDHLNDGERIFGYRLLRIARGDKTPMESFDEDAYAIASEESPTPIAALADTFDGLRKANIVLVRHLPEEAWKRTGTMSGTSVSVRALVYILAGHVRHHQTILAKRLDGMV